MNSSEMVIVARLADHYEKYLSSEHDALEVAEHDFLKFKRDAPTLRRRLYDSSRSDREIGDWLYKFFVRWTKSGMSLKNFAAEEEDKRR